MKQCTGLQGEKILIAENHQCKFKVAVKQIFFLVLFMSIDLLTEQTLLLPLLVGKNLVPLLLQVTTLRKEKIHRIMMEVQEQIPTDMQGRRVV